MKLALIDSEEWRPVVGFESSHEVSSLGRVRSVDRYDCFISSRYPNGIKRKRSGRYLSPHVSKQFGYATVSLNRVPKLVHRLVAEAFLPNSDNLPVVNHLNHKRADNRVENLEWTTQKLNIVHSTQCVRGENNATAILTERDVLEIRDLLQEGKLTQVEIGKMYGVSNHAIFRIKAGYNWAWLTGLGKEDN